MTGSLFLLTALVLSVSGTEGAKNTKKGISTKSIPLGSSKVITTIVQRDLKSSKSIINHFSCIPWASIANFSASSFTSVVMVPFQQNYLEPAAYCVAQIGRTYAQRSSCLVHWWEIGEYQPAWVYVKGCLDHNFLTFDSLLAPVDPPLRHASRFRSTLLIQQVLQFSE